jgi:hypothetical protein
MIRDKLMLLKAFSFERGEPSAARRAAAGHRRSWSLPKRCGITATPHPCSFQEHTRMALLNTQSAAFYGFESRQPPPARNTNKAAFVDAVIGWARVLSQ